MFVWEFVKFAVRLQVGFVALVLTARVLLWGYVQLALWSGQP